MFQILHWIYYAKYSYTKNVFIIFFSEVQIYLSILYDYLLNLATLHWKLYFRKVQILCAPTLRYVVEAKTSFLLGYILVFRDISILIIWGPKMDS